MRTVRNRCDREHRGLNGRDSFGWRVSAVALLLVVHGCADTSTWQKSGTDAATLDQDLQQCTQQARLDARREEVPRLDSPLTYRADPQGRPVVVPNTTSNDRYLAERDLVSACMRSKGYALTPPKTMR